GAGGVGLRDEVAVVVVLVPRAVGFFDAAASAVAAVAQVGGAVDVADGVHGAVLFFAPGEASPHQSAAGVVSIVGVSELVVEDGADLVVAFPLVALFVEGALGAVLAAEGDGAPQRPTDDVAVPSAGDAVREAAGELEAHRVALEVDAPACAFELDGEDVAVEIALDVMEMAVAGLD